MVNLCFIDVENFSVFQSLHTLGLILGTRVSNKQQKPSSPFNNNSNICLHQPHHQGNEDEKTFDKNLVQHQHMVQLLITQCRKPVKKKKTMK